VRTSGEARARKHKLPAVLAPALLVVVASITTFISGCSAGSAGSAARNVTSPRHPHTYLAVPPQAPVTRGAKWMTGSADKLLTAVNADLGKVTVDQQAGKYSAAKSAGTQLAAAARAALDGPMPPANAVLYRSALKDFEQIGTDAASGSFSKVDSFMAAANLSLMKVTEAADPSVPNAPENMTDPNG
jgi:hypothetical protein